MDLSKSSSALEEINEQFRHVAPKLSIISFHETLPTLVGPKKVVCVAQAFDMFPNYTDFLIDGAR